MKKLLLIALLIVGCVFGQSNPYDNNFTIEKYQNEACKVVANIDWNKYISDMDVNRRGIPKRTIDSDGNINFDSLQLLYNYSNMNKYIVSKKFYHLNGQIILDSKYQNGQKEGNWIYYNINGIKTKEEQYENNKLTKHIWYKNNGQIDLSYDFEKYIFYDDQGAIKSESSLDDVYSGNNEKIYRDVREITENDLNDTLLLRNKLIEKLIDINSIADFKYLNDDNLSHWQQPGYKILPDSSWVIILYDDIHSSNTNNIYSIAIAKKYNPLLAKRFNHYNGEYYESIYHYCGAGGQGALEVFFEGADSYRVYSTLPTELYKGEELTGQNLKDWNRKEEKKIRQNLKFKEISVHGYPILHPKYNPYWEECPFDNK